MENYTLNENINVLCVTAESFPDGVLAAHQKLHSLFPPTDGRRYFGLSRPDQNRKIIYKAAVEKKEERDADMMGLEELVIQEGDYYSIIIRNFMNNETAIGKAFTEILQQDDIDPEGVCVEWYLNNTDVQCMVRKQSKA